MRANNAANESEIEESGARGKLRNEGKNFK